MPSLRDLVDKVKQTISNIPSQLNDNQGWIRQGQFTPSNFSSTPIGNSIAYAKNQTRNFLSGSPVQFGNGMQSTYDTPLPTFKEPRGLPQLGYNLFAGIPNSVIQPVAQAGTDLLQNTAKMIGGKPLINYDQARSPLTRIGMQLATINRPDVVQKYGVQTNPKQVIGNMAGAGEQAINLALMGGTGAAKNIAKNTIENVGKEGFLQVAKKGALEMGKIGGSLSLLNTLSNNRGQQDNLQYLKDAVTNTVIGTVAGAGLGSVTAGGAYLAKSMVNKLMTANPKMTPQEAQKVIVSAIKDKAKKPLKWVGDLGSEHLTYNDNTGNWEVDQKWLDKQRGFVNFGEMKPELKTKGVEQAATKGLPNVENKLQQQLGELTKTQSKQISSPPIPKNSSLDSLAQAKKLEESISSVLQETETNKVKAEWAKQVRGIFTQEEIARINKLKKITNSKAFREGDIETLRKQGDTVNKVVENVMERNPNIKNEADALDYALSFPTKQETIVKKPQLTPAEKQLRFEAIKKEQQFNKDFGQVAREIKVAGADKSLFEQSGATLTPKQYSDLQTKRIRIQSEASKRAELEANKYFKDVSIPAYKQGRVDLGDSLPSDELLKAQKDKMSLAYWRETIQRNIEDIFGKDSKMKKFVVDNITNNENRATQFQNELKTKLEKTFEGIKKGSREDMAMGDYIEKNITIDQLKKEFPNKWQKIVNGSEAGRLVYKDLLGKINEQLQRFGYDPIPERQNYVTHTNQLQSFSEKIGNLFNVNSDNLPRQMAGINMDVKPGRKFFNFGLERKGGSTHEGLITALEKYIPSAARQIYHTEDIQRGRAILDFMQKSAGEGDTRLSNFTSYFSEYVDHLAGKQNVLDRGVEKILGRKFLAVGSWIKSRTGANMVGGNVSSALTNFIPFTQSIATTNKEAVVKGLAESATNFGKDPSVIDGTTSGFLLRRFARERISSTLGESIQDKAGLLFKIIDKFTSTSVVAGKYFEGLQKGLSREMAMARADDYAQRVMADRSFGQSPLLFNSKVLGALTQFQLEVNNQMSFLLKDIPNNMGYSKSQIASSLVQFGIYSYLFNELYQKITGRRPQIDPVHIVGSTVQDLAQGKGLQAFNPISPTGGFNDQTGTGELLNQLPFSSIGAGRIPASQALTNPQYYLLPPFGGGQLKKTIEGVEAFNQGGSFTNAGNVRFPIDQNTPNRIRTTLFGQYSTPEAVDYYKSGNKPLSDANSELFKSFSGQAQKDLYTQSQAKTDQEAQDKKIIDKLKGKETPTNPLLNLPIIKSLSGNQSFLPVSSDIKPEYANKIAKVGGKYAYITASGDSHKVDTLREAEVGVEKALFKSSPDNFKDLGDTVLRKSSTGDITAQSKADYNISLYDAKMTSAKKSGNIKTWLDIANKQMEVLGTKLKDPSLDELEKQMVQNKIDTLSSNIAKYESYNGFKKGRAVKKISAPKIKFKLNKLKKSSKKKFAPITISSPKKLRMATVKSPKIKLPTYKTPKIKIAKLKGLGGGIKIA